MLFATLFKYRYMLLIGWKQHSNKQRIFMLYEPKIFNIESNTIKYMIILEVNKIHTNKFLEYINHVISYYCQLNHML